MHVSGLLTEKSLSELCAIVFLKYYMNVTCSVYVSKRILYIITEAQSAHTYSQPAQFLHEHPSILILSDIYTQEKKPNIHNETPLIDIQ